MVEVRHGPRKPVEEGEVITEENVFDRYDEPQGFFPGQVVADLTVSAILLAVVVGLSYAVPAPLTEPMDVSTTVYVPRPEWFFFFLDPWLDKEPAHSPARRPFVVVIGLLVIAVIVLNMLLALVRIANFSGGTPAG